MSSIVLLISIACIALAVSAVESGPNRSRELSLVAALALSLVAGVVSAVSGVSLMGAILPDRPPTRISPVSGFTG